MDFIAMKPEIWQKVKVIPITTSISTGAIYKPLEHQKPILLWDILKEPKTTTIIEG